MNCKNCAANYSSKEPACPYCGTKNPKGETWLLHIEAARAGYEETLRSYGTNGRLLVYDRVLSRILIGMSMLFVLFVIGLIAFFGIQAKIAETSVDKNVVMLEKCYKEERFGEIVRFMLDDNSSHSNSKYDEYSDMCYIYYDYEQYTETRLKYFQLRDSEIPANTAYFLVNYMHEILARGKSQNSSLSERNTEYLTAYQTEVTDYAANLLGFSDAQMALLAGETLTPEDAKALETIIIEKGVA